MGSDETTDSTGRSSGKWRMEVLIGLLVLALPAMCVRLVGMMGQYRQTALAQTERQEKIVVPVHARPGSIYLRSRHGYVLAAGTSQVPSCYADPKLIGEKDLTDSAIKVAPSLNVSPVDLQNLLVLRQDRRFVWLKREITDQEAANVTAMRVSGVGIAYEWRRDYPLGQVGSCVVGFRTKDGHGGEGMELFAERHINGKDGHRTFIADARRRPIWPVEDESARPQDGENVYLYLDSVIQEQLQTAVTTAAQQYGAKWAAGVVADPQTGEILAMFSTPSYDSNEYSITPAANRTNKAIVNPCEMGSALKPVFAAAAVDMAMATWQTQIDCENGVYFAPKGGRISDHGNRYGLLSLADVVIHSSNIGMSKVGEMLGNKNLHAIAQRFGFDKPTGLDMPGECGGILRPLERWDGYSLRRIPFGQEIAITELQLTMAFCSFANGGLLVKPRLIEAVRDPAGNDIYNSQVQVVRRVLSPQVAAQSMLVMQDVVERGTAKSARSSKYTIFGKTGTAQIPGPGGYVPNAYISTFVGGAPVSSPKLVCAISVYWPDSAKGYYGGKVAAPFVKNVLEQALSYLDVPPDRTADDRRATRADDGGRGGW